MGLLIDGQWHDQWYDTHKSDGEFIRTEAQFRHWITADGSAGQSGQPSFKAEADRYHLYVSLACPWAHRTLIFRQLKGLQKVIGVTVVDPDMLNNGWELTGRHNSDKDELNDHSYLYQLYQQSEPDYSGRVTVPVLWDKQQRRIVNNESSEIIRMFNSAFNGITGNHADYYPSTLQTKIDEINERVYQDINNGVYRCGFATTQTAYDAAFDTLFKALDFVENILSQQPYLAGDQITEADWRLFTTLVRFDAVYVGHFKCNRQRIADYQNIDNYLRELYQIAGIGETVNMAHIKQHYYVSQTTINPTQIVAKGPTLDFDAPHNRHRLIKEI